MNAASRTIELRAHGRSTQGPATVQANLAISDLLSQAQHDAAGHMAQHMAACVLKPDFLESTHCRSTTGNLCPRDVFCLPS